MTDTSKATNITKDDVI